MKMYEFPAYDKGVRIGGTFVGKPTAKQRMRVLLRKLPKFEISKGGRNDHPSQVKDRPPSPEPLISDRNSRAVKNRARSTQEGNDMTWFTDKRQDWIAEMLRVYGFINRAHLVRKFGISQPQASNDLTAFQQANPDAIYYDNRKKEYRATTAPVRDA